MKKVTAKELKAAIFDADMTGAPIPAELLQRLAETLTYYDNMAGETFRAPNLSNATLPFMVDELGEIQGEIKPRQTYEKVLKEVLKAHRPDSLVIEGERYSAAYKWVSKMIVDGDAVKRFTADPAGFVNALGGRPPGMSDFYKVSEYWEIRTSKKPEA